MAIGEHFFASTLIDLSLIPAPTGVRSELRLDGGWCHERQSDDGVGIEAHGDLFSGAHGFGDDDIEWLRSLTADDEALRTFTIDTGMSVRVVHRRRLVSTAEGAARAESSTYRISRGGVAVVSPRLDAALVSQLRRPEPSAEHRTEDPILFRNGSGAVLMHEAIGHPAERGLFTQWPSWLHVYDDPAISGVPEAIDDRGRRAVRTELTAGQAPDAVRRWTHRDLPQRRMSSLTVTSDAPAAELPSRRIEVSLVEHGSFDELTDRVTIRVVAAELVDGTSRSPLHGFTIRLTRQELRHRLRPAAPAVLTYPGVICATAGQFIPVGSAACDLLLEMD